MPAPRSVTTHVGLKGHSGDESSPKCHSSACPLHACTRKGSPQHKPGTRRSRKTAMGEAAPGGAPTKEAEEGL